MLQIDRPMIKKTAGAPTETLDPQVKPKPVRRSFTTAYKLSILEQADQCQKAGEIGTLLRREGLYSSHLSTWRRLRRHGTLQALTNKKRGPQPTLSPAERRELGQLRRHSRRYELCRTLRHGAGFIAPAPQRAIEFCPQRRQNRGLVGL